MRADKTLTGQEYTFDSDAILMSSTDLDSHLTYANFAFIEASGYSRIELMGQPHNLVRHPDMPKEAFADMWATLKSGQSWTGLVKNRRKCGGHYWVKASAAPVKNGDKAAGYVSVRTKPARSEVKQAEALYQKMRAGELGGRKLHKGILVYSGFFAFLSLNQTMSSGARIWSTLAVLVTALAALAANIEVMGQLPFFASCIGLFLLTGIILDRQIIRPLKTVLAQACDVASGKRPDLIELNRTDELGLTLRGINQAGLNLQCLVRDVSVQIDSVVGATDSLSTDTNILNEQTQIADASLQQTAAAATQMTESLQQNAKNAEQVAELSTKAHTGTSSGVQAVAEVVSVMERIHESSSRVNEFVGLIDSLAFQTNLLALNAAVEAARAGEAGKGFAVVAVEVRNLSERSTKAAAEIRAVISESGKEVDEGARLANDAGATMQSLQQQMAELTTLVDEISTAVTEQSIGVADINNAINDLDSVTTGNSQLVESSSKAVAKLHARSQSLSRAVARYA